MCTGMQLLLLFWLRSVLVKHSPQPQQQQQLQGSKGGKEREVLVARKVGFFYCTVYTRPEHSEGRHGTVGVSHTTPDTQHHKHLPLPHLPLPPQVTGEEEIPEGVVAVLTPDAPDVLSHVSVRARNMRVLFATCHDKEPLAQIRVGDAWQLAALISMCVCVCAFGTTGGWWVFYVLWGASGSSCVRHGIARDIFRMLCFQQSCTCFGLHSKWPAVGCVPRLPSVHCGLL